MKKLLLAILFVTYATGYSQTLETRITKVENGLNLQSIVNSEQSIIKSSIIKRLEQNKIHGASVAVINDGKIEWLKTYGIREFGKSTPVTKETLFQCASIGKMITALAVLNLVEDGRVDLDEDINNKLNRWKFKENEITKKQKVTLRYLLSHSAGFTDDYGFLGYNPKNEIPNLLQILNNEPPANTKKTLEVKTLPGKIERYSGGGYLILQLLIEDLSGLSYADYIQQHVFDPLEMTHSTYEYRPDKNLGALIATGHLSNGKTLRNRRYNIYPELGAAGPWTTAEDLAKLVIGIQNSLHGASNSILSSEATREFLRVQINNKGLGVNLKGIEKPKAFWHAGQNLGYTALLYGLIEKGAGAVILLNSDGGERLMQEFITSVAREYEWPVMKTYRTLQISPELQSKLVGKYENIDSTQQLSIEQRKGTLFVKSSGSKKRYRLYRIEENRYTFRNSQDYYKLSFNFEDDIAKLVYSESVGKTIELKKME